MTGAAITPTAHRRTARTGTAEEDPASRRLGDGRTACRWSQAWRDGGKSQQPAPADHSGACRPMTRASSRAVSCDQTPHPQPTSTTSRGPPASPSFGVTGLVRGSLGSRGCSSTTIRSGPGAPRSRGGTAQRRQPRARDRASPHGLPSPVQRGSPLTTTSTSTTRTEQRSGRGRRRTPAAALAHASPEPCGSSRCRPSRRRTPPGRGYAR